MKEVNALSNQQKPEKFFDQKTAASYDKQWQKTAPIRDALHLLISAIFTDLPEDAHILCVGAGTGAELLYLAQNNPQWSFAVVEPSGPMLEVCRQKAEEHGIASRCVFHEGYVESFEATQPFHGATALLVSQFILDRQQRTGFFRAIAERLQPGGYLVNSDLSYDIDSPTYQSLLEVWLKMMAAADVTPEMIERVRNAYRHDVAVLPQEDVSSLIVSGGFEAPIQFFQGGLIHAWYTRRPGELK